MTRDEVTAMAREAGVISNSPHLEPWPHMGQALERFAALVEAKTKEACAQLLDDNADQCMRGSMNEYILRLKAKAIRASKGAS